MRAISWLRSALSAGDSPSGRADGPLWTDDFASLYAILNDRTALANKAIEEGALPDVRSPNERNKWQATRQRLGFGLCLELVLTHAGAPLVIEVVRYCGVAAASRAARAMDAAFVRT